MIRRIIILIYSFSYVFGLSANSTAYYNNLSLHQKLGLLFASTNAQDLNSVTLLPGAIIGSLSDLELHKENIASLRLINVTDGVKQQGREFPSNEVIKASSVSRLGRSLYKSFISSYPYIDGLLTKELPEGITSVELNIDDAFKNYVVVNPSENNGLSVIQAIPLPEIFVDKFESKVNLINESYQGQIGGGLQMKSLLQFQTQIGQSLEDFLSTPCLFVTDNLKRDVKKLADAVENQLIDLNQLEDKIKWILDLQLSKDKNKSLQNKNDYRSIVDRIFVNSLCLVSNNKRVVPLKRERDAPLIVFDNRVREKTDVKDLIGFYKTNFQYYNAFETKNVKLERQQKFHCLLLVDDKSLLPKITLESWRFLHKYKSAQIHLVLIDDNIKSGIVSNDYSCYSSVLIGYQNVQPLWRYAIQGVFGGISINGKLLHVLNGISKGIYYKTHQNRLGFGMPERVNMHSEKLKKIDSLMTDAVQIKATPGGQLIIARKGVVVYRKTFGKTSYTGGHEVAIDDIYDIASVTKVMATTPLVMNLYDNGKLTEKTSLRMYLPETDTTNKGDLLISEIMRHKAGLSPMVPNFYSFIDTAHLDGRMFNRRYSRKYPYKLGESLYLNRTALLNRKVFQSDPDNKFNIKVSDHLFMNNDYLDTVYHKILSSNIDTLKAYRYSDMGFNILQRIIERLYQQKMDELVDSIIYKPLGLTHITYLPLKQFSKDRIVPTEYDKIFRKQLLQGYVHDPGAAIIGGVAGNAGLFSNADDLAVMMQMYLNKGVYGGKRLFKSKTIELFTSQYADDTRRGLGFDKPEPDPDKISPVCEEASLSSFGHMGFTGTMVWADPKYDLVFVFLSNRVHPNSYNKKLTEGDFRTKAMKYMYQSMIENATD